MGIFEKRKQAKRKLLKSTSMLLLCHPLVAMLYYVGIGFFLFAFQHPWWILWMFLLLLFQMTYFMGYWYTLQKMKFYGFVFLLIGVGNPFFVHRGKTILFYWMEKPMTLEALSYGMYMGSLIVCLLLLCDLLYEMLGTKKILYLLGQTWPQTAFMVGMTLRYTVTLKQKGQQYLRIQQNMRSDVKKHWIDQIRSFGQDFLGFSAAVLEEGMEMSETLKAKAYGKGKRTHYQVYFFYFYDWILLVVFMVICGLVIVLKGRGVGEMDYYRHFAFQGDHILQLIILGMIYGLFPFGMDVFFRIKRILNNGDF